MTFEQILQFVLQINPLSLLKWGLIVGFILYTVFAYVMLRQEQLMSQIVFMPSNVHIRAIIVTHLLAALVVLLLTIIIL